MIPGSAIALLAAFFVAIAVSAAMWRAGVIDRPNERSNHLAPTPRGAGLAILAGFAASLILQGSDAPAQASALVGVLIGAGLGGALGLADDLFTPPESVKFLVLTALSVYIAASAGPVSDLALSEGLPVSLPLVLALLGSALWVFTLTNAVNFMDGSDGLMAGALAVAALGLGQMAQGDLAFAAYALCLALAGFALFNAPFFGERGKLFAGDAGALSAALAFAGLSLAWARTAGPGAAWLAALLALPFLADVLVAMAVRARAGRKLFSPHRAHAYQLLIRMGVSHRRVALYWTIGALLCAILANSVVDGPVWMRAAAFGLAVAVSLILLRAIRKRARQRGLDVTR